jgi:hypothetical protein
MNCQQDAANKQLQEPDMAAERETSLEASSYNDEHEMMGRDEGG